MNIQKWLYPGIRFKRWVFLFALSCIVLGVGVSGLLGRVFTGIHWDIEFVNKSADYLKGLVTIDIFMFILGILGVYFAFRRGLYAIGTIFMPNKEKEFVNIVYERIKLKRGPKIVAIGGGTGLPTLLQGLKEYTSNITAIVTVADDGGSSGKIRRDFKILPPGDIRNCLVALADAEPLMAKLFQYRFKQDTFDGHSFGNLFITAMTEVVGDFGKAVKESSKILSIHGRVLPVSLEKVALVAELKDKTFLEGQSNIAKSPSPIERVFLKPQTIKPTNEVLKAIASADAIVMGPGSLYTSIIPNLLVNGVVDTIVKSRAVKIYICNIMTQSGETDNYTVSDHLKAIIKHTVNLGVLDYVVVNSEDAPSELLERYKAENSYVIACDVENIRKLGITLAKAKILSTRDYLRHDSLKLAHSIMKILAL